MKDKIFIANICSNKLEKVFLKLCYTPIFLIQIFSIKWNLSSMNIFSIYIYMSSQHTLLFQLHRPIAAWDLERFL